EQLVSSDGSADAAPVDIADTFGFGLDAGAVFVPPEGAQSVVGVQGESAAVNLVGAGLGRDRDGGAAGHPLFRLKVIGRDVDFFDAFHRRDIHHVVRHGDQNIGRAVYSGVVVAAVLAVHIGCKVALGG